VKVTKRGTTLYIKIKMLDEPRLSNTGNSWLIATTNGPRRTKIKDDGEPLYVIVNAFRKRRRPKKSGKKRLKK
jgi:hypothetical protein